MANLSLEQNMPDVASQNQVALSGQLKRVGMSHVELPLRLPGQALQPAHGDFYVSLDKEGAKGIHMSRLYLLAEKQLEENDFSFEALDQLLDAFLQSHTGLSLEAFAELRFDTMLKRPSLLSDNRGWRFYPTRMSGTKGPKGSVFELHVRIAYSSTCPCSAALARQLIQRQFVQDFGQAQNLDFEQILNWLGTEQGIVATPHSQRSHAEITLRFDQPAQALAITEVIDTIEGALQTAVQAAVKREDEQEFARLNGQNTMFCEDAARRVKSAVETMPSVSDYRVEVRHIESLHPHDAVAIVTKGKVDGLKA